MLTLSVDKSQIKKLHKAMGTAGKRIPTETVGAINATATWTQGQMKAKKGPIGKRLNLPAGTIKKSISIKRANRGRMVGTVVLRKDSRPGLEKFKGTRQTGKGVRYKVGTRQNTVLGAFMGSKPGQSSLKLHGGVFKRVGKRRTPIVKLRGASPWGAFVINRSRDKTVKDSKAKLIKELDRRIRKHTMKNSGQIK